ncbi:hypothetical protein Poli38472_001925 [Pythium oligandrum]|uniref:Uncharacterized protein n=1 Tax=Pythium oligandrum TaxID=41045 RepID=A0A8K1CV19_PYTOL|nr:hypothetical protein Poli38472_001925 [Pythium oligandrum]|eukprot:TMW69769.1 hypothetical protein Poli38472_001925 [Pythium oligandrum]
MELLNDPGRNLMVRAALSGQVDLLELLYACGLSVNTTTAGGDTPLHKACMRGHVAATEWLLAHDAGVNAVDSWDGKTPLHYAAKSSFKEGVKALLAHGVQVNIRDTIWYTPLVHCLRRETYYGSLECSHDTAFELVKHGAGSRDSFEIDHNDTSALECVVEWWINERQEGKPLTRVPVDVLSEGQANTEAYLKALCLT